MINTIPTGKKISHTFKVFRLSILSFVCASLSASCIQLTKQKIEKAKPKSESLWDCEEYIYTKHQRPKCQKNNYPNHLYSIYREKMYKIN